MSNRPKIPVEVQRAVFNFYGARCVVCEGTQSIDVAHIDDNNQNSKFENLIPLCSTANQTIERSKHLSSEPLSGESDPRLLYLKGHEHFRLGNFPGAYACHRLASQLFETRLMNRSSALDSICAAIGSLRPLGQTVLLRHTIRRAYYLLQDGESGLLWKAEFLSQLGLVLFDFGLFPESLEFQRKAWHLYQECRESAFPESVEVRKAAAARRAAVIEGPKDAKTNYYLRSSTVTFEKYKYYRGIGNNLQVQAVLETMKNGLSAPVMDFVQKALLIEKKIGNPWVVGELYYLQGLFYVHDKQPRRAIESLEQALKIFTEFGIIPEPSPALKYPDPQELLLSLGVADAKPLAKRGQFPLNRTELKKFYLVG